MLQQQKGFKRGNCKFLFSAQKIKSHTPFMSSDIKVNLNRKGRLLLYVMFFPFHLRKFLTHCSWIWMLITQCLAIHCPEIFTRYDPAAGWGGRGARNMKSMRTSFLWLIFTGLRGGGMAPRPTLDPLLWWEYVLGTISYICYWLPIPHSPSLSG